MLAPSRSLLRYLHQACHFPLAPSKRLNGSSTSLQCNAEASSRATFSTTTPNRSGHSKWATIKHDKARADAKKNKQRSVLAQQIELMVRLYGPDPSTNPRLKTTVADAKRQGLPKDVLDSAIKRGQGLSTSGKPLEPLTIEAQFPGNVAGIIECLTESKAKTLMEVRTVLTKNSGSQASVAFLFQRLGVVSVVVSGGEDEGDVMEVLEPVLEVEGFEDFEEIPSSSSPEGEAEPHQEEGSKEQGKKWELLCSPSAVKAVADAVEKVDGVSVEGMEITWRPADLEGLVSVDEETAGVIEACVEKLEEMPDVREVFLNMRR